jgi:hypothetical protein
MQNLGWSIVTFPKHTGFSSSSHSVSADVSPIPGTDQRTIGVAPPSGPGQHPLQQAAEDLFSASQAFFALPAEEKAKWKSQLGSEEGWSHIPGEKEFITLRTLEGTPDILKAAAQRYWELVGAYLDGCLGRIENALGQNRETGISDEETGLRKYVGRCKTMGAAKDARSASMIRLFRYEGSPDGDAVKVVAEPHADLGLLSYVVGNVPGLEVWDGRNFFPVETTFERPARMGAVSHATLLSGRQLEWLSNGRFPAGGHRVVSYPRTKGYLEIPNKAPTVSDTKDDDEKAYRYSIVFVLRADEDVIVNTDALTTPITGIFARPLKDVRAGDWYKRIQGAHFNINTGLEEREVQRRKIVAKK